MGRPGETVYTPAICPDCKWPQTSDLAANNHAYDCSRFRRENAHLYTARRERLGGYYEPPTCPHGVEASGWCQTCDLDPAPPDYRPIAAKVAEKMFGETVTKLTKKMAEAYRRGKKDGRKRERGDVTAYLRREAAMMRERNEGSDAAVSAHFELVADWIARCEHHEGNVPPKQNAGAAESESAAERGATDK